MADFDKVIEALEKYEAEVMEESPFIAKYSIYKLSKGQDLACAQMWDLTVDMELHSMGKKRG